MTRIVFGLALLAVSPLAAQTFRVGLAAGQKVPVNGESYPPPPNQGWQMVGVLEVGSRHSRVAVRVDGTYGETVTGLAGSTSRLTGGSANLVYHIGAPLAAAHPYLLAGLGVYDVIGTLGTVLCPNTGCPDPTSSSAGYGVGAGVSFGGGPTRFVSEARYISVRSDRPMGFILVTMGVSLGN